MKIDSLSILHRFAQHFRLKNSGSAVATFLEVSSPQIVYNWRIRNNIDLHIVVEKARLADPNISLDWLIYGEGPAERTPEAEKPIRDPKEGEGIQTITNVIITNEAVALEDLMEFIKAKRKLGEGTPPEAETPTPSSEG